MSVVGFDIGNQNSYIAVARQGGVETATNDYSQRATPSCVSFGAKSRCMGVAARQQVATNLKNTVLSFKNLIGRQYSDPIVQAEKKFVPFEIIELPGNFVGVKVNYLSETRVFTPEQILAILLTKLKELSESYLKTKVSDCVLSVPSYWTDCQRRALLDAAKISDLNCLKIINDTTATALAYGIYKQDLPEENEKPRRIVFVDMGHVATQICLCAFNKGKLKMIGNVWDLNLGGRDFDEALFNYFNEEFKKKYKIDANTNPRARFRLVDECEKVKKQMSANPNPIPLSIECLMNDKDVTHNVKRSDFEEMASSLWAKFTCLLNRILTETKTKPSEVDFIELVGGSSRMPMIRQIVQQIFNKDPFTTLNQDEAVSRGCALQCAILSPTFRVREFNITDVQPFAIKLNWKAVSGLDEGEMEVFNEHHAFPFSKILTFYRKEPFVLEASYAYPNHIPYPSTKIGHFLINDVVPSPDGENSKVKVKVRLNSNGLFSITSASLYEIQQKTEDEQQNQQDDANNEQNGQSMDTQNDNQPSSPTKAQNEATTTVDEKANAKGDAEPMQTDVRQNGDPDPAATKENDKGADTKSAAKSKIKLKSVDLPVKESVSQMTEEDIKKFRSIELELQKNDRMEREKADAKNALEEYVYDMRNQLSEKLVDFVTQQEKAKFVSLLENIENWLYEDGDDQPKEVYVEKLVNMRKIGDPICERYQEAQERPVAFDDFGRSLLHARKFCDLYAAKDPKYDHIDAADAEKVSKALNEKQAWYEKQLNSQNKRPLTEPPVVFAVQIRSEKDAFERIVLPIMNKPKPKVEIPPEPPANDKAKTNKSSNVAPDDAKNGAATAGGEAKMDVE